MISGDQILLPLIAGVAACVGVLAGVFYGWVNQGSGRPLAETLTGLLSGLLSGGLMALALVLYGKPVAMFGLAAGIVALVGGLFQFSERRVVDAITRWCPRILSAPVVAGLIAAVVGAGIWAMTGATSGTLDATIGTGIGQVAQQVPSGLLGGMLGGALTGVLLEISGAHLEDHDQAV